MNIQVISIEDLNKLIKVNKDNTPCKKALLIVKSGCTPYHAKGISRRVAVKVANAAKTSESFLAKSFEEDDDIEMWQFHEELASELGPNVIKVMYGEDNNDDE